MQNENPKVEDQEQTTEPVAEVKPSPEPQPEQVSDTPAVEPNPEPFPEPTVPEPTPEHTPAPETPPPTPEPEQAPIVEPTPPPPDTAEVSPPPEPPKPEITPAVPPKPPDAVPAEPPKPEPQPEPPKELGGIPQKVLDLTPQELDAARRLWITKNIHSLQKLSTKARHTRRLDLLNQVESFVHANAPVKLSKVAYELNISEPKASDYLRILVKSGRIKATGQTTSRRYS